MKLYLKFQLNLVQEAQSKLVTLAAISIEELASTLTAGSIY